MLIEREPLWRAGVSTLNYTRGVPSLAGMPVGRTTVGAPQHPALPARSRRRRRPSSGFANQAVFGSVLGGKTVAVVRVGPSSMGA